MNYNCGTVEREGRKQMVTREASCGQCAKVRKNDQMVKVEQKANGKVKCGSKIGDAGRGHSTFKMRIFGILSL